MEHKPFTVDFIGVGFPRCGTTWISKCIAEHPAVCFSNKKEVQFFNTDFDYNQGITHYQSFFTCNGSERVVGEFTPEYFMYDKTLERIRRDMPHAKLLFSVRNPIERAFSHYLYRKRKTGVVYPIEDIFNQDQLPPEEQILYHGFYYKNILRWVEGLPKEQYLVVVHDDAKSDAKGFIAQIYNFLGVDADFIPPSLHTEINKSKNLRYKFRWIQNVYAYRTKLKRTYVGRLGVELLKKIGLSSFVAWIISKNFVQGTKDEIEVLSPEIRARIREVYAEDITQLERLLGRDLSFWK